MLLKHSMNANVSLKLLMKYSINSAKSSNIDYCNNLVRKLDYESYLCCLLLPKISRTPALVLRSFVIEVTQIQDQISNQQIGLMKFQFWKDALDKIYMNKAPESPVCQELNKIINKFGLTKAWFSRLIEAREEGLILDKAFMSIHDAEEFYMKSIAPFYFLILQTINKKSIDIDHVVGHICKGQGLATLIRSVPYHIKRRKVYLPHKTMIKHGVSQQNIIESKINQNMKDLFFDIAATASVHFEKASALMKTMPKSVNNYFLFATPSRMYLTAIQNKDFNIFDPQLLKRNPFLPITLFYKKHTTNI